MKSYTDLEQSKKLAEFLPLDKEILLRYLCAMLPYKTMVKCTTDYRHEFDEELSVTHIINFYQFEVKPYLRPMSSMTDEEKKELEELVIKLNEK